MLSFENSQDMDSTLDTMRSIGDRGDYLQQELLPALLRGDWEELDKMVVYQDQKKTILFGEDIWAFRYSDYKGSGIANLIFNIEPKQEENVIVLHQKGRHMLNQMKCVALAEMWFSVKHTELASINNKKNSLRKDIAQLIKRGINSFEELNQGYLEILVSEGWYDISRSYCFIGLNNLVHLKGLLPFKVNFSHQTHKIHNVSSDAQNGKVVIPPRIYFAALKEYSEDIVKAYGLRDEIEQAVEQMISLYENELERKILRIRKGYGHKPSDSYVKSWEQFTQALNKNGITLVDKGEDPRWMQIFTSIQPRIQISGERLRSFRAHIGNTCYGWGDFRRYLRSLNTESSWLCLTLSGMRVDELYKISPVYGAQRMTFNKNGCESETGKETIYFLTTRQSKITLSSQTKNDTFVTTQAGWKAFHMLNAINTPYRKRFEKKYNHRMFANLKDIAFPNPIGKSALHTVINTTFNRDKFDFTLTAEDMAYLQTSDPAQTSFNQGDKFHFSPHQTRRTLAYYLIGYELCSFPALKQQFSHLSMAMTRWYARNAYSFEKLYSEIQKERVTQQAEIFARIYQKMANGKRIAGGKGQAAVAEISRQGESYFEDGLSKRKLSIDYWIDRLTNGKEHLHAIAPGMYCTNTQCSMRINIDLSECVDCEYDFIENAVYAESSRMDAMRNIEFLKENNELNSSSATKYLMQVKAAEAIMDDLGFKYEKYEIAEDVLNLVIDTTMEA
ncbi:integrase [Shewanella oncorhynchi]|uniref:Integrase n=1 Tax=Shewanella oncorhynchi TaxID=2726434 RepID=A0AA50KH76_9GAMM|nr:integrase [Shewanella oncorhynchi]WMB75073.1 integrase [Shewanella oncorhynchi]